MPGHVLFACLVHVYPPRFGIGVVKIDLQTFMCLACTCMCLPCTFCMPGMVSGFHCSMIMYWCVCLSSLTTHQSLGDELEEAMKQKVV